MELLWPLTKRTLSLPLPGNMPPVLSRSPPPPFKKPGGGQQDPLRNPQLLQKNTSSTRTACTTAAARFNLPDASPAPPAHQVGLTGTRGPGKSTIADASTRLGGSTKARSLPNAELRARATAPRFSLSCVPIRSGGSCSHRGPLGRCTPASPLSPATRGAAPPPAARPRPCRREWPRQSEAQIHQELEPPSPPNITQRHKFNYRHISWPAEC